MIMSDLSKTLKLYVQGKNLDNKNNLVLVSTDLFLNEVKKNQKVIIDVDRSYIKQFVQIGSFLKTLHMDILDLHDGLLNDSFSDVFNVPSGTHLSKLYSLLKDYYQLHRPDLFYQSSTMLLFKDQKKSDSLSKKVANWIKKGQIKKGSPPKSNYSSNDFSIKIPNVTPDLTENICKLLGNNIHLYEKMLITSLLMIDSLLNDDLISFYEFYDEFDKQNVFNSNWENETTKELKKMNDKFDELLSKLDKINNTLVNGFHTLSTTLNNVESSLKSINSSVKWNVILTGINTYQLHKLSKKIN